MKSMMTLLALLLTGCAPLAEAGTRELPVQRIYADATKAEVWDAVMTSLRANDLPVVAADFRQGKIRVRQHNYLNGRWAACPNIDRRSFDPLAPANLGIRTAPLYRGVDLRLEITATKTGTRLALDPRFFDVGRDDGRRAFAFQTRCRSTGILEQALIDAAAGS